MRTETRLRAFESLRMIFQAHRTVTNLQLARRGDQIIDLLIEKNHTTRKPATLKSLEMPIGLHLAFMQLPDEPWPRDSWLNGKVISLAARSSGALLPMRSYTISACFCSRYGLWLADRLGGNGKDDGSPL